MSAGGQRISECLGGFTENDHMCAVIEIAQQRLKEIPQLPELLGAQDLAGVEHDCFQARPWLDTHVVAPGISLPKLYSESVRRLANWRT
ncbi:hypothetical protein IBA8401_24360 [Pseudomonas syringae]